VFPLSASSIVTHTFEYVFYARPARHACPASVAEESMVSKLGWFGFNFYLQQILASFGPQL
jgi:hypothetical protein